MKLVDVVGFITKKFVTMHGHVNVIFFVYVAFCVFLWMNGKLVRTSLRRLLITPADPEFDNCGGADISMRNLIGLSS